MPLHTEDHNNKVKKGLKMSTKIIEKLYCSTLAYLVKPLCPIFCNTFVVGCVGLNCIENYNKPQFFS